MKILRTILNLFRRFIFFIIKEIFSFFIKLILSIFIIAAIFYSIADKYKKETRDLPSTNFYVKLDFSTSVLENNISSNLINDDTINFYSLLDNLESMKKDKKVEGLLLNLSNIDLNYAQIEEISKELEEIRNSGIKILAYMENVNKKNYLLASYANEIFLPYANSTNINIYPYFRENLYTKNLTDKLGVKFNIVNIGDYKSYQENLSHTNMTKENREDITRILDMNYNYFLDEVAKNRKIKKEQLDELIQSGIFVASTPSVLFANKLIDGFYYLENLEENIGKEKIVEYNDYATNKKENNFTKNIIHVIPLEGNIGAQTGLDNSSAIESQVVIKELKSAIENDDIKAIVLRVNSPGGSAFLSDEISQGVFLAREAKPIYVSMGGVAASGGYYISALADKIFVDKNSITGSIGVVSIIPDFTELLNKLEVNNEKVYKGKFSDLYSTTDFNEEKYNKIKESNLKVYDDFLEIVSNGRKIEKEKLKNIAEGKIWTGEEAVKNGLADNIGGLKETILAVAKDFEIENYKVQVAEKKIDYRDLYKKYSRVIKIGRKDLLKKEIFNEELYNKPVLYLPYEVLD